MGPPTEFKPGMRLKIGKDRCTIRWIGVLEGDKFERLGLEWDDVSRGRHSGEFGGRSYFKPNFPNSASFIKKPSFGDPSSKVELGIGLLQGLRERYLESDITGEFHVALEGTPSVQIETRGWSKVQEKLSNPLRLKVASVSDTCVSWIECDEVLTVFPNLEEVDLSRTLISEWSTLFGLVMSLPHLHTLRLDENRIRDYETKSDHSLFKLDRLTNLSLNETYVSTETLRSIAPSLQHLHILHLRKNRFQNIPFPGQEKEWFPALRTLNLSQNCINGRDVFENLGSFPSLEHLDLSENGITWLYWGNVSTMSLSLKRLNVSYNSIDDWGQFAQLYALFPSLSHLQALANPAVKESNASRTKLIAMVPGLALLNLSPITPRERVDAELYYLNRIASPDQNPHFTRLCEVYGKPTQSTSTNSALLKHRLFLLNILLCERPPSGTNPLADLAPIQSQQKQFLKTATLRTLEMALPKLLQLSPTRKYQLYAIISAEVPDQPEDAGKENPAQVIVLDNPVRPLQSYYLLKEGDTICVVPDEM